MNFYETWIYNYVINTEWLVWGLVGLVFLLNLVMPLLLWFIIGGRLGKSSRKPAGKTEPAEPRT